MRETERKRDRVSESQTGKRDGEVEGKRERE
jgi:hypothetical protein